MQSTSHRLEPVNIPTLGLSDWPSFQRAKFTLGVKGASVPRGIDSGASCNIVDADTWNVIKKEAC